MEPIYDGLARRLKIITKNEELTEWLTDFGELSAVLDLSSLPASAPWDVGLTAVIEEAGGRVSYWALKHAPAGPDFHHADGFTYHLAAEVP